jgi:hypothetical protein
MKLESNFQRAIIANEQGQLFTLITKGQVQSLVTLPGGQNFDFIFPGRLKFLKFFST